MKISATPTRAAVFVDNQFAGHVDEFDGVGKAMLLTPGRHSVRVALPGYLPFETVVDMRAHQKVKLQTDLVKGSITEAGSLVNQPDKITTLEKSITPDRLRFWWSSFSGSSGVVLFRASGRREGRIAFC